jgi:hypothetical protein
VEHGFALLHQGRDLIELETEGAALQAPREGERRDDADAQ